MREFLNEEHDIWMYDVGITADDVIQAAQKEDMRAGPFDHRAFAGGFRDAHPDRCAHGVDFSTRGS